MYWLSPSVTDKEWKVKCDKPSELPEDDPRGSKHVGANIVI